MSPDAVDWNVVKNMIRLSHENFVCAVARGWKLRLRLRRLVNPGAPEKCPVRYDQRVRSINAKSRVMSFTNSPLSADQVHTTTQEGRTVAVLQGHTY